MAITGDTGTTETQLERLLERIEEAAIEILAHTNDEKVIPLAREIVQNARAAQAEVEVNG